MHTTAAGKFLASIPIRVFRSNVFNDFAIYEMKNSSIMSNDGFNGKVSVA